MYIEMELLARERYETRLREAAEIYRHRSFAGTQHGRTRGPRNDPSPATAPEVAESTFARISTKRSSSTRRTSSRRVVPFLASGSLPRHGRPPLLASAA